MRNKVFCVGIFIVLMGILVLVVPGLAQAGLKGDWAQKHCFRSVHGALKGVGMLTFLLGLAVGHVLFWAGITGLALRQASHLQTAVSRARAKIEKKSFVSFLVGLLAYLIVFFTVAALCSFKVEQLGLLVILILLALFYITMVGMTGELGSSGSKLLALMRKQNPTPANEIIAGGIGLGLVALVPILGQLVVVVVALRATGGVVTAQLGKK